MKVQILRSAMEDIAADREFYDRQEAGVGDYFFDSLFAEIDSLALYGGIHSVHFGFHRLLAKRFLYAVYSRNRRFSGNHAEDNGRCLRLFRNG